MSRSASILRRNNTQMTMKNIDQPIATVMTKNVITIELTEHNLESAERLFRKHKIKHLPIVTKAISWAS